MEAPSAPSDSPKNKVERLETRISTYLPKFSGLITKFFSSEELEALLSQKEQATSLDANPSSSSAASTTQNSPSSIQSVPSDSSSGSAPTISFPNELESLLSLSTLEMSPQTIDPYVWNDNPNFIGAASVGFHPPLLSSSLGACGDLCFL